MIGEVLLFEPLRGVGSADQYVQNERNTESF